MELQLHILHRLFTSRAAPANVLLPATQWRIRMDKNTIRPRTKPLPWSTLHTLLPYHQGLSKQTLPSCTSETPLCCKIHKQYLSFLPQVPEFATPMTSKHAKEHDHHWSSSYLKTVDFVLNQFQENNPTWSTILSVGTFLSWYVLAFLAFQLLHEQVNNIVPNPNSIPLFPLINPTIEFKWTLLILLYTTGTLVKILEKNAHSKNKWDTVSCSPHPKAHFPANTATFNGINLCHTKRFYNL